MFNSNCAVPLERQKFFGRRGVGVRTGRPLALRAMADADVPTWFRDADRGTGPAGAWRPAQAAIHMKEHGPHERTREHVGARGAHMRA